jgi:UrcA family protein
MTSRHPTSVSAQEVPMKIAVPVALIVTVLSVPAAAQGVEVGPQRYAVRVARAELQSATPAAARRALHRIDRAATAACGGGGGSLHEITKAVQASACWREAVGNTVRQINAPLLSQAFQDRS